MATLMRFIALIVAFSAIPCVLLALRKHATLRKAELCSGTVVDLEERRDSDGSTYALVIEYRDRRSVPHRFVTGSSSSPAAKEVGDAVAVFHSSDGEAPEVMVFEHLYLGYWIWLCLSLCAVGWLLAPSLLDRLYLR